jgi:serine/threonine protein phosphatase 1
MPLTVTPWQPCPAPAPEGRALFALGDVHGCADKLARLHDAIRGEIDALGLAAIVVRLGDYVDRGPDTRRALELVAAGLGMEGVEEVNLRGNHDDFVLGVLEPTQPIDRSFETWICNGGYQALHSLGLADFPSDAVSFRQALSEALGWELRGFLWSLALSHRIGDLLFVHAVTPLYRSTRRTRTSSCGSGSRSCRTPGRFRIDVCVVHGHTPGPTGVFNGNRIAVDSSCFQTGCLTAAEIVGDRVRFLMTAG